MSWNKFLLRRVQSDVSEMNWYGLIFDQLTKGQAVMHYSRHPRRSPTWLRLRMRQPMTSGFALFVHWSVRDKNCVSSVQLRRSVRAFSFVPLLAQNLAAPCTCSTETTNGVMLYTETGTIKTRGCGRWGAARYGAVLAAEYGQTEGTAATCQISSWSDNRQRSYGDFLQTTQLAAVTLTSDPLTL